MTINSFLNILLGAKTVAHNLTRNVADNARNTIEDAILKGDYVSREEFDALKSMVLELNTKFDEYSTKNKKD